MNYLLKSLYIFVMCFCNLHSQIKQQKEYNSIVEQWWFIKFRRKDVHYFGAFYLSYTCGDKSSVYTWVDTYINQDIWFVSFVYFGCWLKRVKLGQNHVKNYLLLGLVLSANTCPFLDIGRNILSIYIFKWLFISVFKKMLIWIALDQFWVGHANKPLFSCFSFA